MPISIHSLIDGSLLHQVYRLDDFAKQDEPRVDFGNETFYLQAAAIRVSEPRSFPAHTHLERSRSFDRFRAMESWVVVRGSVNVTYFDMDDKPLVDHLLQQGDMTITFFGGHSYEVIEQGSLFYEFKSGPYEGQSADKRFI